jgi:hypothetical protein
MRELPAELAPGRSAATCVDISVDAGLSKVRDVLVVGIGYPACTHTPPPLNGHAGPGSDGRDGAPGSTSRSSAKRAGG